MTIKATGGSVDATLSRHQFFPSGASGPIGGLRSDPFFSWGSKDTNKCRTHCMDEQWLTARSLSVNGGVVYSKNATHEPFSPLVALHQIYVGDNDVQQP